MKKVLIANRGEIACRIIKTLKKLSIGSVAIYSEADRDSLHVKLADEAICIGKAKIKESYINIGRIIAAAELKKVDAIHPGYGFLSENSIFAEIVKLSNIEFIGPSSLMISCLGDKVFAKKIAKKVSCPIIAGCEVDIRSLEGGLSEARKIGYPICIKATAGGGGKGIRFVYREEEFKKSFEEAKGEAKTLFSNDKIYLEKLVKNAKHIEVQLACDKYGNCIHLFERDCSLQRKRQKLIEEGGEVPIPCHVRENMYAYAKKIVQEVEYYSLATVEFLLDENNRFYFLEVNTRIQVEHTVTEQLTGIDLIDLQIQIQLGKRMLYKQKEICLKGHVIEFRINAEDPSKDFFPSTGVLKKYGEPKAPWCRVDSYVYSGYCIQPYYDSLIAKLIISGKDRNQVIERAKIALKSFFINGIKTTIPLYLSILEDEVFRKNCHHITYLQNREKEVFF